MIFTAFVDRPAWQGNRSLTNTLLAMKLTILLLTTAALQVTASGRAQTVTFSGKDVPLEKVFSIVEQQTGYVVFFDYGTLEAARPVTLQVRDLPLTNFLDEALRGQPFGYSIRKTTIFITKLPVAAPVTAPPLEINTAAVIDIHGRVTDSLGNPMAGASVTVKGVARGVETDANGVFELKGVTEGATLMVSYTGYQSRQYKTRPGQPLVIVLSRSTSPLDEIVVIAYGTTTQRTSTGNVSTVKSEDIEKQPVDNPLLALEGRVPGLYISQATGVPGSAVTVRIEGQNSIAQGNDPLYVIDGVPYSSKLIPDLGQSGILGLSGGAWGNPLSFINPAAIDNIEVLKDADATAIYGSRAANGAILITTKKGKAGQTKVNIDIQNGWGKATRFLPLMNTKQYLAMRREAFRNANQSPGPTDYDLNGAWDTTRSTDWQKVLLGGTAQYADGQASVSGGAGNTTFFVGLGYHRETTVFPGDLSDQNGSVHFNIGHFTSNRKFHVQFSGDYLADHNNLIANDLTNTAVRLAPDAPALHNPDGSLNWAQYNGVSTWINPLAYLNSAYDAKTNNLNSSLEATYQVLPGLELKTSLGYSNLQKNTIVIGPLTAIAPERRPSSNRSSSFGYTTITSWNAEPWLTYKHRINKGQLETLIGTTFLETNSNFLYLSGIGYNSDLVLKDIRSAASVTAQSSVASLYHYNAVFGRINYNWLNKYIFSFNARRDGSSRFGPSNELHNFESGAMAWVFSNEDFLSRQPGFLSFGKLRASYGTTGNDQIGDYGFLSLYSTPLNVLTGYQGSPVLYPQGLPNPYLQWEETKKLQFGLDLGFFKDRVLVNANYYRNRSSNQLLSYKLPNITGFGSIRENFPATIQNSGWEISLTSKNFESRGFSWSTNFNITIQQNKLLSFPNLAQSSYAYSYEVGKPITAARFFHGLGVDPTTGFYIVADAKGNATSNPSFGPDYTALVNTAPKYYGGLENTVGYRGFELDFLFQFVRQKAAYSYTLGNQPGRFASSALGGLLGNQPVWVLSRWQKPGDIAPVQMFTTTFNNANTIGTTSDMTVSDASFIRLKNVALSWQLPAKWLRAAHLEGIRLFVHGQNLLTFTKFKGMDPESQSVLSTPPLRIVTFGIHVGL